MARPLDRFPLVRTRNPDEMAAALARVYAKPKLSVPRHTKEVDVWLNYHQLKGVGLGYTRYGVDMGLVYPPSDFIVQTFPLSGRGEATIGNVAAPLFPGHGITVTPGMNLAVRLNANYEHLLMVIDAHALGDKLATIVGRPIDGRLQIDPVADRSRPAARALRSHLGFLIDRVSNSTAPLAPFVLDEFAQALLAMALYANRHNYSHLLEQVPADPALAQIRRVEDYIAVNFREAVTLETLVQVSGVSALSLFRAFRKHRGYSPYEFLSRVRREQGETPG